MGKFNVILQGGTGGTSKFNVILQGGTGGNSKFNVILQGGTGGTSKIQNCIWETMYSNGNKNTALLKHTYFQQCNTFLPVV
jgi:hypothetical protein